jgi:hypothetical protein
VKHVILLIHLHRDKAPAAKDARWQLNFASRWRLVVIDSIEVPQVPLATMLNFSTQDMHLSVRDMMDKVLLILGLIYMYFNLLQKIFSLDDHFTRLIDWAILCIKYPFTTQEQLNGILLTLGKRFVFDLIDIIRLKNTVLQSVAMMNMLKTCVQKYLPTTKDVLSHIANSKATLLRHPTLLDAITDHILNICSIME